MSRSRTYAHTLRNAGRDQWYCAILFQSSKGHEIHTNIKQAFMLFFFVYISSTERPKAWKVMLHTGNLYQWWWGDAIDTTSLYVIMIRFESILSSFDPSFPFRTWGKSTTNRQKQATQMLHLSIIFISMEQQSHYIDISATAFSRSKEIKISQGFHSAGRLHWGRLGGLNNHTGFYLGYRWFLNVQQTKEPSWGTSSVSWQCSAP